ncbi:MAG: hypothetical protein AMXMBFR84_42700 [Candidatus Hydrogenedentota bacterium]
MKQKEEAPAILPQEPPEPLPEPSPIAPQRIGNDCELYRVPPDHDKVRECLNGGSYAQSETPIHRS